MGRREGGVSKRGVREGREGGEGGRGCWIGMGGGRGERGLKGGGGVPDGRVEGAPEGPGKRTTLQ